MSEFKKVPAAVFGPRHCALCLSHEGPFADTELDIVPFGHIYLCLSTERRAGCVRQLAKLDDMVPAQLHRDSQDYLREARAQILELQARTIEVVPLTEVREGLLAGMMAKEE